MNFYVYEHWRLDRDECFYVGKGRGKRAYDLKRNRNRHHQAIVAKVIRDGFAIEIKIVAFNLLEEDAFVLEAERIAFWRSIGVDLANITNGGGGASGYKHTEKALRKISESNKGKVVSEEARKKISQARKGRKIGPLSEKHRKKISEAKRGKKKEPFNDDWREKISESLRGNKRRLGILHSDETRKKMSESQKRVAQERKISQNNA